MRLLPILILLICSTAWAADQTLFPADVQAVLNDYDAKVAKAKADVVTKLQKAQEAATKKGNLDLAMALKAKVAEFAPKEGDAPKAGRGIKIPEGATTTVWDNASAFKLSGNPHSFSFYVNTPEASKQLFIRAKPGYGCERVILDIEGRSGGSMAKEYTATLSESKTVFRVDATHAGSGDGFSWGPLQYRTSATDEWTDIPTSALAPK